MITITKRNKQINPPLKHIHNWNSNGKSVSYFFNTLSLFFPRGERYFIDSVRSAMKTVQLTPSQRKDISGFIAQEAFHGREHDVINQAIDMKEVEDLVDTLLTIMSKHLPVLINLGVTVSLEHLTAIMAQTLLRDRRKLLDGSVEGFEELWLWHALEETEHKAVAFDLFQQLNRPEILKYGVRTVALIVSTIVFSIFSAAVFAQMNNKRRDASVLNKMSFIKTMFVSPAFIPKLVPLWLDWFRPGFHPWDHDNSSELERYNSLLSVD